MIDEWTNQIHRGDMRGVLGEMPADSVHMAMTSPPYWQLRDYGSEVTSEWGGDPSCDHDWTTKTTPPQGGENTDDNPPGVNGNAATQRSRLRGGDGVDSRYCPLCGAWEGQFGLEPDVSLYVDHIVEVGEAIKRVLRPDGSWWLNLGDTYDSTGAGLGLGEKQLGLIPQRAVIALQEAGWTVRNVVIWEKVNPMPSPVKDRLTTTTERLFHLTPNPQYYYDLDAIREPHKASSIKRATRADNRHEHSERQSLDNEETLDPEQFVHPNGKNPGDVIELPVKPYPEAHFAAYPPKLCTKPIKASAPKKVCASCGTPYTRQTEDIPLWEMDPEDVNRKQAKRALELADEHDLSTEHLKAARTVNIGNSDGSDGNPYHRVGDDVARLAKEAQDVLGGYYREFAFSGVASEHTGWEQQCDCDTDETRPGIVLDPFAGSGSTLLRAKQLDRRFIGVELNPEYVALAQKRVGLAVEHPEYLRDDDNQAGLESFAQ